MVIALEVFPIVGVTDFKPVPTVPSFTLDWTGIPIMIIFLGLGLVYSFIGVLMAGLGIILHGNLIGAVFKVVAESFTILGLLVARQIGSRMNWKRTPMIIGYVILAALFRSLGMYVGNIVLLPVLVGLPLDIAVGVSTILIPWNAIQAIINVAGGVFLYYLIPENLALQAGLGDDAGSASSRVEELPLEEIESSQPDDPDVGGQG
jgi:riboflavin transporter FmnP